MQINKKLISAAIIALMLISAVAVASPAFAIDGSEVALSTDNGAVGTVVTIAGNAGAAQAGGLVKVYWENLAGTVLNETYALGSGAFELKVTIPAAEAGPHSLIIQDAAGTTGKTFTVEPKIVLSATRGIPADVITVTGTGYAKSDNITVLFNSVDVTSAITTSDSVGAFTATFAVPNIAYGTYNVIATDNETTPNWNVTTFTIGAAIAITPTSGPAGTIVTITGRGFTAATNTLVSLAIGNVVPVNITTIRLSSTGTFTGQFVVPSSLAVSSSRYMVSAYDGNVNGSTSGTGSFRVTGTTTIMVSPTSGQPGNALTLEGGNFTAIEGTVITVKFGALAVGTFAANATGGFKATFNVPNLPTGSYDINATDANKLTDIVAFQVAITLVTASPSSGPSGTVVTVTGYGFTPSAAFNVTFGSSLVGSGTVGASTLTSSFIVPTISPTTYSIIVTDATGLTATTTFTVTAITQITVNPTTAPVGTTITVTAKYFSADSTITFVMKNATASFLQSISLSPSSVTNASGTCVGTFVVPDLALGTYTINGTDANGLNTTTTFTVGSATFIINTRATSYRQGDTLSFKIQSSFAADLTITIIDPEGTPAKIEIDHDWFMQVGSLNVLAYSLYWEQAYYGDQQATFTLPSDAPTGKWTWNTTAVSGIVRTGEFTVISSISGAITNMTTKIDKIDTTLSAINATLISISGNLVTLQTSTGTITTAINNLPSTLTSTIQTSVQNGLATITSSIGTITTKLSSIDAVIGNIAGDVVTLSTSLGDVTTTLADIGAVVCDTQDDVVTIKTDLGTLQGVVTQIKDGVATIQTGVGTLTVDVSELQGPVTAAKDNTSSMGTMIYVAVAFAIIAAIAAVASILLMRKKIAS